MESLRGNHTKLLLLNLLPILFWIFAGDEIYLLLLPLVVSIVLVIVDVCARLSLWEYVAISAVNLVSNIIGGIISTMIVYNNGPQGHAAIDALVYAMLFVGGYLIFLVGGIATGLVVTLAVSSKNDKIAAEATNGEETRDDTEDGRL